MMSNTVGIDKMSHTSAGMDTQLANTCRVSKDNVHTLRFDPYISTIVTLTCDSSNQNGGVLQHADDLITALLDQGYKGQFMIDPGSKNRDYKRKVRIVATSHQVSPLDIKRMRSYCDLWKVSKGYK